MKKIITILSVIALFSCGTQKDKDTLEIQAAKQNAIDVYYNTLDSAEVMSGKLAKLGAVNELNQNLTDIEKYRKQIADLEKEGYTRSGK